MEQCKKRRKPNYIKALILISMIVSVLGYIDYITGEVSIDILYLFCVFFVTWYTNGILGIICILEIVLTKLTADYYDKINILSGFYDWNIFNTILVNFIVCVLVIKLKKALNK